MARRKNRRRCAHPLDSKSGERIQETDGAKGDQNATGKLKKRQPQQGRFDTPMGDPPGRQAGYEPRGDDQENRRDEDRERLPNHVFM